MELYENRNGNYRKLECRRKSTQKETEQNGSKIKSKREAKEKRQNLTENPFKMSDTRRTDDYIVYDE